MIGERIKKIRGNENQTEFGARFGLSRSTILRYETGERVPDADFIAALCKEYDLSSAWLLFGTDGRERWKEVASNTGQQAQDIIMTLPLLSELIEVRGSTPTRVMAVNYILVRKDFHVEYYVGALNCDRPQREAEVRSIRDECQKIGCKLSYINDARKYTSHNQEMSLLEGLELVQTFGGYVLEELSRYMKATGSSLVPVFTPQSTTSPTTGKCSTIPQDITVALKDPEVQALVRGYILGRNRRT